MVITADAIDPVACYRQLQDHRCGACVTFEGSSQSLSSWSRLALRTISFVRVGLRTLVTFTATDHDSLSPIAREGSS